MKVSIIIPIYNAAPFLGRCLKTVLAAVTQFAGSDESRACEVLLIDNDSDDDSLLLMGQWRAKYPEIVRVLQCHTEGAAAVRNFGASRAAGEYIWFVDADDAISTDALELLISKADETNADVVMMGASRIYPDGSKDYLAAISPTDSDYKSRFVRYGAGIWQLLIRRSFWFSHDFIFHEGIIHEDMELISSLVLYTDKFEAVDQPLYEYYQNENSILHPNRYNPHIYDIFSALEGIYARFKKAGALEKYHDEIEWLFVWSLLLDAAQDFTTFPEGKIGFKRSREMLNKYFPKWRSNQFLREKPLKMQMKVRLNYQK